MTTTENYTPDHLKLWTRPPSYFGANWPDFYVFLGRSRDSETLTNCNWDVAKGELDALPAKWVNEGDDNEERTVQYVRENHWAVGWVEWIAIHKSDTDALKLADELAGRLENYLILDEEKLSEMEMEEANQVWKNYYREKERIEYVRSHRSQFEFRSFADLLGCIRGKYFAGYASELLH